MTKEKEKMSRRQSHDNSGESTDVEQSRHDSFTILLVDDEKVARMVTRRKLERLGHRILEAEQGRQALERLQQEPIDLVISDWMMPEMDGPTLCEAMKADERLRSIPILLMTALDQSAQIAEGLRRGADDFLNKSCSTEEMTARVNVGLRTRQLVKSLADSNALISKQQAELHGEVQSAAEFVTSLLPSPGEIVPGIALTWKYRPSLQMGGDLFQIALWEKDYLGLMILDMSGHGIGPALRAVSLALSFQGEHVVQRYPTLDPAEIVGALNKENPLTDQGEYFTIWVGCLHLPSRELRYATAGHPGAIVTRIGEEPQTLGDQSWPIGFGVEETYQTHRVTLQSGDQLYLFSDGIYEVMSPHEELWGHQRLAAACQAVHGKPMGKALQWIIHQSQVWQHHEAFDDDVALIGLAVK